MGAPEKCTIKSQDVNVGRWSGWTGGSVTGPFLFKQTTQQSKENAILLPQHLAMYPTAIAVTFDRLFNMSMNTERHAFNLGFDCEDGKQQR